MLEHKASQLSEQLQIIEQNVLDLLKLQNDLDDLKSSSGKEVFSSVGRGIFVKSKIESDSLLIDVGDGNFIRKDVDGSKKWLGQQVEQLQTIKKAFLEELDKLNKEMEDSLQEVQGERDLAMKQEADYEEDEERAVDEYVG
mgnify:CR=1 FL=1